MAVTDKSGREEQAPGSTASIRAAGSLSGSAIPTITPVGAYVTSDHRYYFNGIGPKPSVTTILGVIDKPAVGIWKAKSSVRATLDSLGYLPEEWSEDDRIRWALASADEYRDARADLGTSVHLLAELAGGAESDSKAFQVSDEEKPYLDAYRRFLERYSASSIVSSEHAVWSQNGYGGTYDLIMRIDGELWLIDIKSSGKGPYPDWALQLAGYRWADFIILPGDPKPYPMPEIDRTGILHLQPELYPTLGYRFYEYPTEYELDYLPFLGALELYQWRKQGRFNTSKLVDVSA